MDSFITFADNNSDLLALILTYLPTTELSSSARSSKVFAAACRRRRGLFRTMEFTGKGFGESRTTLLLNATDLLDVVEPLGQPELRTSTLLSMFSFCYNLTRLDLHACRVNHVDFVSAMQQAAPILRELRLEMVLIGGRKGRERASSGPGPTPPTGARWPAGRAATSRPTLIISLWVLSSTQHPPT
jgi:hypothetical protein